MNKHDAFKTAIRAYASLLLIVSGIQTSTAQEEICASERGERNGYAYEFWSQAG